MSEQSHERSRCMQIVELLGSDDRVNAVMSAIASGESPADARATFAARGWLNASKSDGRRADDIYGRRAAAASAHRQAGGGHGAR
jgi:hypothetical protein